jgi:jumonji domain-containing protein 2
MVLLPQELLLANIPFRTLRQQAGDYVITLPEGLHFVVNSGHSIAEATNYACVDWEKHRKRFPVCICEQSKNKEDIAARFNF